MDPRYQWSPQANRYRDLKTGRFVTPQQVHQWLLDTTANAGRSARDLTQLLRTGAVDLRTWQLDLTNMIRLNHIANAAAAKGGLAQMTTADYQRVEQTIIRRELEYLDRFAKGIADGSIPLDGRVLARAEQYMLAGTQTYADFHRREMVKRGMSSERNVRGKSDSCAGCLAETARGWVPIGPTGISLPGTRDCLSRCGCRLIFR